MSALQQSLSELQSLFDAPGGSKGEVSQRLAKLKLELAQSGLYFAPPGADVNDLVAARSILELGAFHSLRTGSLKSYQSYNSSLQPFYALSHLPASPNRPITLGLHLLSLLSEGQLTQFHTLLETLETEQLGDVFVRLPVDLERWLMEGAYNKVYRARDRMPREEFGFLLEKLMGTVRWVDAILAGGGGKTLSLTSCGSQIATTIEASYPSLPMQNAASLLFFKPGETSQLVEFTASRKWTLQPTTSTFTFPPSSKPEPTPLAPMTQEPTAPIASLDSMNKGVTRGVPMRTMVGPALRLAQELEAIV